MITVDELDARWHQLSDEVITGMKEWRLQHPRATFQEIEQALDERLARLRARMLQDAALLSQVADMKALDEQERPLCPQCGSHMKPWGQQQRKLTTSYEQTKVVFRPLSCNAVMRYVPNVKRGFSPLDEELQLLPGQFTPSLAESLVRLSTWMPFPRAAKELAHFTHVTVSEPTVRRDTETAGAAYVAVQTAEVERLERELPPAPLGPELQLLSVDGAMVPLIHQEWAEVKTLAVGRVEAPILEKGVSVVHSTELSYFSRLADAQTFGHLALVETHRRGTENAQQVCAVTDGAEWEQRFIDLHREDAVRILDFPHAAGYVAQAGQAVWGEGTDASRDWLRESLHELKHGSPDTVLDTLRDMRVEVSTREGETNATVKTLDRSLAYLEKRRAQIEYARFQAAGYPLGSGSVESANKLVVEARLKGAGMHWARPHVDPMVALRNIACSDRWDEAWTEITQQWRQQDQDRRIKSQQQHRAKRLMDAPAMRSVTASATTTLTGALAIALTDASAPDAVVVTPTHTTSSSSATPRSGMGAARVEDIPIVQQPYRPPPDHPWRRFTFGRTRYQPARPSTDTKL